MFPRPLRGSLSFNETIDLYGEGTDVKFQAHHWPMWGHDKIIDYWKKQRLKHVFTACPLRVQARTLRGFSVRSD
jgi:alkyl sulfatase BDS1-like metallo-beta-lactamase superfamily hydrolase